MVFRKLAEPLYYEGPRGLASLTTNPEMRRNMEEGIGPLGFISAATHSKLQKTFFVLAFTSLVPLGLLIFFSYRFGRLGHPLCFIRWAIYLI